METEENQIVVFDSTSSHLFPSANGTSQGNQVASEAPQKFPHPRTKHNKITSLLRKFPELSPKTKAELQK